MKILVTSIHRPCNLRKIHGYDSFVLFYHLEERYAKNVSGDDRKLIRHVATPVIIRKNKIAFHCQKPYLIKWAKLLII